MALPRFKTRKMISSQPTQMPTESPQAASAITRESAKLVGNIERAGTSIASGVATYQELMRQKEEAIKKTRDERVSKQLLGGISEEITNAKSELKNKYSQTQDWGNYAEELTNRVESSYRNAMETEGLDDNMKGFLDKKRTMHLSEEFASATPFADKQEIALSRSVDRQFHDEGINNINSKFDALKFKAERSGMLADDVVNTPEQRAKYLTTMPSEVAVAALDAELNNGNIDEAERLLSGKNLSPEDKDLMDGLSAKQSLKYKNAVAARRKAMDSAIRKEVNAYQKQLIKDTTTTGRHTKLPQIRELTFIANGGGENSEDARLALDSIEVENDLSYKSPIEMMSYDVGEVDRSDAASVRRYENKVATVDKMRKMATQDRKAFYGEGNYLNDRHYENKEVEAIKNLLDTTPDHRTIFNSIQKESKNREEFSERIDELAKVEPAFVKFSIANEMSTRDSNILLTTDFKKDIRPAFSTNTHGMTSPNLNLEVEKSMGDYISSLGGNTAKAQHMRELAQDYAKYLVVREGFDDAEDAAKEATKRLTSNMVVISDGDTNINIGRSEIGDVQGEQYLGHAIKALQGEGVSTEAYKNVILKDIDWSKQSFDKGADRFLSDVTKKRVVKKYDKDGRNLVIQWKDEKQNKWVSLKDSSGEKPYLVPIDDIIGKTKGTPFWKEVSQKYRDGEYDPTPAYKKMGSGFGRSAYGSIFAGAQ